MRLVGQPAHPTRARAAAIPALGLLISALLAPACAPPPARPVPSPCTLSRAPAPGPLADKRAGLQTQAPSSEALVALARVYVEEARISGDSGFYTLADQACACALETAPGDPAVRLTQAEVWLQLHRFAEAEATASEIFDAEPTVFAAQVLGDARAELGRLDAAAGAYQFAADRAPGPGLYDRIAYLRWSWGDYPGAMELQARAIAASPPGSESWAWSMTMTAWWSAMHGQPATGLDTVLSVRPDYGPALFHRARIRLHNGDAVGARTDLARAPTSFEARRLAHELGDDGDLRAACALDRRGCAAWLLPTEPSAAYALLVEEQRERQDAATLAALAWAERETGRDGAPHAEAAKATGTIDPRTLLFIGLTLDQAEILERALGSGPGLLPSEVALAKAALATREPLPARTP